MCGISLLYFEKNYQSKDYIKKFTSELSHRGPDGTDFYNDSKVNLSIGHNRLSIIDTSDLAKQPFIDNENRFVLSYNGEIFNYIEIRKELEAKGYIFRTNSDTEVLLNSYVEWGEKCLFKFNGFWAFIIYDKLKRRIFISRDRFGVKPLYYYFDSKNLIISSELKAFKSITNQINIQINTIELMKLRRRHINQNTILKKVNLLLPGSNIHFDFKNLILHKWWETANHLESISKDEAVEKFEYLFKSSCNIRLRSDVPLTSSLSGGLDSSSVVAEINQDYNNIKNHLSFFVNYNYKFSEKNYVDELKSKYNLVIKELEFNDKYLSYENLLHSTISQEMIGDDAIGPWMVYKNINLNGYKVSIDGHGPDELMGGYDEYRNLSFFRNIYSKLRGVNNFNNNKQNSFQYFNVEESDVKLLDDEKFLIPKNIKGFNQKLYYDFHYGSLPLILEKFDKISMSHGIESREPFLDWRIVTLLFSLPTSLKFNENESKIILKKIMKNKLPNIILERRLKKGFNPDNDSFMQKFKQIINNIVFSNDFKNDDFFKHKKIIEDIKNKNVNYKKLFRYIQAFFLKKYLC